MKELRRHELTYKKTLAYVKDNLSEANTLSNELLDIINFESGQFFTLIPDNSNLKRLYEFETGLILPQNPEMEYYASNHCNSKRKATFSIIPTIQEEVANFLFFMTKKSNAYSLVFDDFLRSANSPFFAKNELKIHAMTYNDEIYYYINNACSNLSIIKKCILFSNAIWHSLCVLTAMDLSMVKELTLNHFKTMLAHAKLIMIGAYDGEGYIFWEKN